MKRTSGLLRGALAGAVATGCEAAWSACEPRLLGGRRPVFDTSVMAHRLVRAASGRSLDEDQARRIGTAMRLVYGPSWAMLLGVATARHRPKLLRTTVLLAGTIWVIELATLPLVRATPPLRLWPGTDVALDLSNTVVYAAAATLIVRAGRRDGVVNGEARA